MALVFKLTQLYFSNQHYFCKEFFLTSFPAWTAYRLDNAKTMDKKFKCAQMCLVIFLFVTETAKKI